MKHAYPFRFLWQIAVLLRLGSLSLGGLFCFLSSLGGGSLLLGSGLLRSLELLLLLGSGDRLDGVAGAGLGAHGAVLALAVVDDSHVVLHVDGVELTGTLAHAAGDTAVGADLGDSGALVLVGAVDVQADSSGLAALQGDDATDENKELTASFAELDRKSTRLNSSHKTESRMPSSA